MKNRRQSGIVGVVLGHPIRAFGVALAAVLLSTTADAQEYYYESYQVSDQHRFQDGAMGGSWGHHLGHMVRTATQGLWYVDDTGRDVTIDPNITYHRFDGTQWVLMRTLANPQTIQQNTVTLAIGDSLFTYGLNTASGYVEEAVCDTRTNTASYNRRIRYTGLGRNYIGAAVSPGGTRVVWWVRNVAPIGPSDWVYMYNKGDGWSNSIISSVPANDFSYVFASFLNDTTFHVGGELVYGYGPWTFNAGAGMVVLGQPLSGLTPLAGANIGGNAIWSTGQTATSTSSRTAHTEGSATSTNPREGHGVTR